MAYSVHLQSVPGTPFAAALKLLSTHHLVLSVTKLAAAKMFPCVHCKNTYHLPK